MEIPVSVNYQSKQVRVSHFRPFVDFWRNAFTFTRLIVLSWFLPRLIRVRVSTHSTRGVS
jgi:hypothetical protein